MYVRAHTHTHTHTQHTHNQSIYTAALAQLGLTLPVEEASDEQCQELFRANSLCTPTDTAASFRVQKLSMKAAKAARAKERVVNVVPGGLVECAEGQGQQLVHRTISWSSLSHLVRLPTTYMRAYYLYTANDVYSCVCVCVYDIGMYLCVYIYRSACQPRPWAAQSSLTAKISTSTCSPPQRSPLVCVWMHARVHVCV